MFKRVLSDPELQADQWKVYPCEVTPWTIIKKWFDKGEYVPYPENDLIEMLVRGRINGSFDRSTDHMTDQRII